MDYWDLQNKDVIQSIDEDSKALDELVDCAVYLIKTKIPISSNDFKPFYMVYFMFKYVLICIFCDHL